MIEAFAATAIHHYLNKEKFEGKQDPAATVASQAAAPVAAAATVASQAATAVYRIIWLLFSVWTARIAYMCNGNSFLWAVLGFFMPVLYLVIHVAYGLRCDQKITGFVGGRRAVRSRK